MGDGELVVRAAGLDRAARQATDGAAAITTGLRQLLAQIEASRPNYQGRAGSRLELVADDELRRDLGELLAALETVADKVRAATPQFVATDGDSATMVEAQVPTGQIVGALLGRPR